MIIKLDSVASTNSWLSENARNLPHLCMVTTDTQAAGRGQRGNSWESEPRKNITCSILCKIPDFHASLQFHLSEAVALAVVDFLREYGVIASIKWPNDIYVDDKKICGILIEHSVMGPNIRYSICGIGININQRIFTSDAPNPTSLILIRTPDSPLFDPSESAFGGYAFVPENTPTDSQHQDSSVSGTNPIKHESISSPTIEYNLDEAREFLLHYLTQRLDSITTEPGRQSIHNEFKNNLWRKSGLHRWRSVSGEFIAEISDVHTNGLLELHRPDGSTSTFAFKEISPIL